MNIFLVKDEKRKKEGASEEEKEWQRKEHMNSKVHIIKWNKKKQPEISQKSNEGVR